MSQLELELQKAEPPTDGGQQRSPRCTEEESFELLRISLRCAVPLHVQRFIDEGWTLQEVAEEARSLAAVVGEQGSALMWHARPDCSEYRRPAWGTAAVFNALAKGLAACSFQHEGIKFLGVTWESNPKWLKGRDT